ncbi:MAG TPA: haloacid dehalogenase-like hydrolase [Polyangiaceae bacterium]|jgi:phosphoserine phosphatase|nr:haloacid dehalogenase-like hydrolase [Polyangiaceae bacterium]
MNEVAARDLALELAASPKGALSFDGDGTLWSGDVGEDFFYGILDSGKLSELAADAIMRAAAESGVTLGAGAALTARNIYDTYLAGRFDEERVCELMTWINAGWTATETTAFVTSVISEKFAARIHPEVRIVIDEARRAGHEIFVVSASPRPIVEAAAAIVGVPSTHVLAATAVLEGDRFAARVHRPIPYGAGKASALRSKIGALPLLAAFGDNAFDAEMLAMSERPIAVRPKARLLNLAHEIRGIRLLVPVE